MACHHRCRVSGLRLTVMLLTATALFAAGSFAAADGEDAWPFVRGAHFDAHSSATGIVDRWDSEGPPVLWVRKLGQGYSAFVGKGDRVYTQAQNMTGQYLYCLDGRTGQTIWEYRYDWPYEAAGVYPGPRSTPTVYDSRVYFTSPTGVLSCVSESDGRLIWSVDLQQTYGIEGCDFGYACSPTVVDDRVILPVGGPGAGIVAFDHLSGRELWKATDEPASYTPAYPIELRGEPLVVGYLQNAIVILNRESGQLRRRIPLSQGYDEHSAWPIYSEPYLWLSGPFRAGSYCLDLSGIDDSETELPSIWRSKAMSNDVCSSVLADGHIYGFDLRDVQSKTHRPSRGVFRCISFQTGEERWSVGSDQLRRDATAEDYAGEILQCGIIVADGKLIVLNELGELILLKIDSEACTELARCTALGGELTWTAPCLIDGRLYIRNQTQATCIYIGKASLPQDVATMKVGDLPQRQYYDLAAMLLAVEPEYAFDIPHDRWLVRWCLAGLGLMIAARLLVRRLRRSMPETSLATSEFIAVTLAGAIGTTVLGFLTSEFIFTWHLCLFAALEYVACGTAVTEGGGRISILRQRIPLFALLAVSLGYFLICRRLSLVFEWAFLIGFPGAIPIVWLTHRTARFTPKTTMGKLTASTVGYLCFYATAVAFLKSRY
ncbi:MAG: PQQ-binding-like beta-propeller repeat protein [Planctomycetaceae bacterium]